MKMYLLKKKKEIILDELLKLGSALHGELLVDELSRAIYSTDASVYRKLPIAVAYPKNTEDIKTLVAYASQNNVGLIPRTAGTSMAGQCVGEGIVVDVSREFTKIVGLDKVKKRVIVQPGVVRDELNQYLLPYGLFFGPNTSTSNRCMIGGMVGNNSSGSTSIQYGVTRDKVLAMNCVLSDGSEAYFTSISRKEFNRKKTVNSLEGKIYATLYDELSNEETCRNIEKEFPKPSIHRRNTGYAVDEILKNRMFSNIDVDFNLCKLLTGSEGTLAFTTEITLQLDDLPPAFSALVATHYKTLENCLCDVASVMQHNLYTCELMDKVILDCTKKNSTQLANRFFVHGEPDAILMLEIRAHSGEHLQEQVKGLMKTIDESGLSYANPVLYGDDINKAMELRKAGLGLLGNLIGDRKAVACIEDTAVALEDLKDFIGEFSQIMKGYNQKAVYYAHAGAGELHLSPLLNLKNSEDVLLFRTITTEVAKLTKKYKGSFSGEHGDGIVRAEFIPLMIGEPNYALLKRVKALFDPNYVFNPGKIVDALPMDKSLRYIVDRKEPEIKTIMDFSDSEGILRAAEKCNGSGDCRKSHNMEGGMCPSYQVTKNEKDTTRGRANALREFLTNSEKANRFDHSELKQVFDLCLSCKACASECPSNVDVAALKTEFLFQYQESNGYPWRNKIFAYNTKLNALGIKFPWLTNAVFESKLFGGLLKMAIGVALERSLPMVYTFNFEEHLKKFKKDQTNTTKKKVILYIDEFTKYLDVEVGKDAIELLCKLDYSVELFYAESGRTYLSKGFLKEAKKLVEFNMSGLKSILNQNIPIVGIEPSAILSFRDEYQRFHDDKELLEKLALNSFLIEEFLASEIADGVITSDRFTEEEKTVKIHNHCHQKALSNQKVTFDVLNLPINYRVSIIASGCCGMAGSFGYEKKHFKISMGVGNLKLFPAIVKSSQETIIAANGTSCRHQIKDGTHREAQHPVSILRKALKVQK